MLRYLTRIRDWYRDPFRKRPDWAEITILGLTIAIVLIYRGQLSKMTDQLTVMQGTLEEAQRSGRQSTEQVWRAIDNLNWAARSMDLAQKQAQASSDGTLARMEESNRINREALESVQRAFLSFRDFEDLRVQDAGHTTVHYWTKFAVFENIGATSAVDASGVAFLSDIAIEPTEDQFKGHYTKLSVVTVPPKSSKSVPIAPEQIPEPALFGTDLGETITREIVAKTAFNDKLFVWGWAHYRDVFPHTKAHVTEFCYKIIRADFRPDLPGAHIKFVYSGCRQHNCTDEQCKDYREIAAMAEKIAAPDQTAAPLPCRV